MSFLRWGGRGGEGGSINTQLGSCHFLGGRGGGSIDTQLGSCHFLGGEGGEGGLIDTQLGSCHFLGGEGGGSINTQCGKDPQRLWKDRLNLERIRKDLGRITSTWKGSAMTLEGSPQLGKDPQ